MDEMLAPATSTADGRTRGSSSMAERVETTVSQQHSTCTMRVGSGIVLYRKVFLGLGLHSTPPRSQHRPPSSGTATITHHVRTVTGRYGSSLIARISPRTRCLAGRGLIGTAVEGERSCRPARAQDGLPLPVPPDAAVAKASCGSHSSRAAAAETRRASPLEEPFSPRREARRSRDGVFEFSWPPHGKSTDLAATSTSAKRRNPAGQPG
ncbi:hypothetical protein ACCO45_004937 [Purpureocillium lilacinum]|uniref:Uncharacterized protein n=1 Tax=Purpureocillium lilacinum TaxID=33203 RepID=A0ACC4DTZ3_PURLI